MGCPTRLLLLFVLLPASVWARSPIEELWNHEKVSGSLRIETIRLGGPELGQPFTIRFREPLTTERIDTLRSRGIKFEKWALSPQHIGSFYGARFDEHGLAVLLAAEDVLSILPAAPKMVLPQAVPNPFNKTHKQTTALSVWQRRDSIGDRIRGKGVVLVDIDAGLDVFHPLFFHADGGYYTWLDVDMDGAFSVEVDAVDLDGDLVLSDGEIVKTLGGEVLDLYSNEILFPDPDFHVGRDWLYTDTNNNDKRDFSSAKGFTEDTPAYGEPLFVVDDVNQNGVLDVGERLVRLGTSKIRGFAHMYTGEYFERGVNLVEAPKIPLGGSHATGVSSILVGGDPRYTQVHGVAPDAELVVIDHYAGILSQEEPPDFETTLPSMLTWAMTLGGSIFVHEYGNHFGKFGDGSDNWETFLDEYSAEGLIQTTATHNFAGTGGHAIFTIEAQSTLDVPFEVYDFNSLGWVSQAIQGTLRWREGTLEDLSFSLHTPSLEIPLVHEEEMGSDQIWVAAETDVSSRGTKMLYFYAVSFSDEDFIVPPQPGAYTLRVVNSAEEAVKVHAHFSDDTAYAYNLSFVEHVTDEGTLAWPATADSVISVGAYMGNFFLVFGEVENQLRYYSGRGPRIDGEMSIDITAPDDHYTAAIYSPWNGSGNYISFGGTSGALPQVAGAIALAKQKSPDLSPEEIRVAIHESALQDELTGEVPNNEWGGGRIGTYRLVMGEDPLPNSPPTAALEVIGIAAAGEDTILSAGNSQDPDHPKDELIFRWDLDYDGHWDIEQTGEETTTTVFPVPEKRWLKLEVEDPLGASAAVLLEIEITDAPVAPDPTPEPDAGATDIEDIVDVGAEDDGGPDRRPPDTKGTRADILSPTDTQTILPPPEKPSEDQGCHQQPHPTRGYWISMLCFLLAWVRRYRRLGLRSRLEPSASLSG